MQTDTGEINKKSSINNSKLFGKRSYEKYQ